MKLKTVKLFFSPNFWPAYKARRATASNSAKVFKINTCCDFGSEAIVLISSGLPEWIPNVYISTPSNFCHSTFLEKIKINLKHYVSTNWIKITLLPSVSDSLKKLIICFVTTNFFN